MTALYTQFFTASDVTMYIENVGDPSRKVMVDLATGIGYRHSISAMPVYGIGNQNPEFFSKGNSIVTGTLEISFKSGIYLQSILDYVVGYKEISLERTRLQAADPAKLTDDELMRLQKIQQIGLVTAPSKESITNYNIPVNIVLFFNNSAQNASETIQIKILGVRFIEFVQGISTSAEAVLTDQFKFIAKNIDASPFTYKAVSAPN